MDCPIETSPVSTRDIANPLSLVGRPMVRHIPDLEQRVRLEVSRALQDDGSFRLPLIARKMAMSPRTLQRRLRESGLSFGAVADEVRRDKALQMLEAGEHTVPDVASALGYRDPRHLFRLVRRWTGTTPSNLRMGDLSHF